VPSIHASPFFVDATDRFPAAAGKAMRTLFTFG
jgi:hypothetical protein